LNKYIFLVANMKRSRQEDDPWDSFKSPITPSPTTLVLRYEDASKVTIPYVAWQYNLSTAVQGYSRCRLLSVGLYNNYSSARLSMLGITIAEFPKAVRGGNSLNSIGTTWCVPNTSYATTGFTNVTWVPKSFWPEVDLDNNGSLSNLTVSLSDGIGSALVASGTPAGFYCDIALCLT
jgi:hypothetical protein